MVYSNRINQFLFVFILLSPITGYLTRQLLNIHFLNISSVLIFSAFVFFLFFANVERIKIRVPLYIKILGLFVFYQILSDYLLAGKSINYQYFYKNYVFTSLIISFLIENTDFTESFMNGVLEIIKYTLIISTIVIIYQASVNPYFLLSQDILESYYAFSGSQSEFRLYSIFAWSSPLSVGLGYIPILIIYLSYLFMNGNRLILFFYIIGAIYSFLTQNRWIIINYLSSFWLLYMYKKERKFVLMFYSVALIGVIFLSVPFLQYLDIAIVDKIENRILEKSTGGFGSGSSSTRILAIYTFIELFPENPIFGKGNLHSFNDESRDTDLVYLLGGISSQMHVGYLSLFYYYGIIGGCLYLLFLLFLMKYLYSVAVKTFFWGSFLAMIGFILSNFTLVSFSIYEMGLVVSLGFNKYFFDQLEESELDASR